MDHGHIITQGWLLVWRNRFFWILGFLVALGGGTVGLNWPFNTLSSVSTSTSQELAPITDAELERALEAIETGNFEPLIEVLPRVLGMSWETMVIFMSAFVIIPLFLWIISLIARAGLIAAVDQSNQGLQPTFGSVVGSGVRALLRVIVMKLILLFPFVVIGLLALASLGGSIVALYQLFMTEDSAFLSMVGGGLFILLLLFCFALPLAIFFQIIEASAYRGIVIQNMGVFRAIGHGFDLFFHRFVDILVLGLLYILAGFALWFILSIAFTPLQILWILLFSMVEAYFWIYVVSVAAIIISVIVVALVSALLVAWQSTTFSLAYLEFIGRNNQYRSYTPPVGNPTIWKTP
ncbi:MAG: hypothetical protein AAGF95_26180 [Chloroflexota bacterium]